MLTPNNNSISEGKIPRNKELKATMAFQPSNMKDRVKGNNKPC